MEVGDLGSGDGGLWRQREATEASSRAQILVLHPKSSPLPTPPGPLKLRLFGEKISENERLRDPSLKGRTFLKVEFDGNLRRVT